MTEVIQQVFDLEGLTVLDTDVKENTIRIQGRLTMEKSNCPKCGCRHTIFKDRKKRDFHLPPIGSRLGILELQLRRCQCVECKHAWWPQLPFAEGKQRMTRTFIAHVLDLLKMGTVNDVANHLGIGWDTVKEIHKSYLQEHYNEVHLSNIEYLSIDEFAIRKCHTYMTVVSDCTTGRIVHAIEGRKAENIAPFLETLKKSRRV